jgi:hypothetical protein
MANKIKISRTQKAKTKQKYKSMEEEGEESALLGIKRSSDDRKWKKTK